MCSDFHLRATAPEAHLWRMSMKRWRGRVALVTGASSGIGKAVAERLAREGMKVAACARRVERIPKGVLPIGADMRDERAIEALFATVRGELGGVDVLINNAGLGRAASLTDGDTEDWREMLDVNVLALSICTREALRDMRARGDDGHVIHVSSMAAHRVPPASGMYSATKYAVRSLTESLRQELRELGSDIRVTSISPGYVETEFAETFHRNPAAAQATYGRFKVLAAEDIADSIVWALACPPHMQVHDILIRPTHQKS